MASGHFYPKSLKELLDYAKEKYPHKSLKEII
jgi:hypothetical protein